ncbi:MAG: Lrp/AsnC family transcriptional regulator [Roseitalea porphyridii]|uniref:Lrp/AsnC family transcriptional regulator n=1 Tax=Roseitalea porphyridii TaxID=1852022 RepID=UPI0032D93E36
MVHRQWSNVLSFSVRCRQSAQSMSTLDPKSEEILRILTRDGRISNIDLAARVNLSPSACLRRVQELERSGVITAYRAVTDRSKVGKTFAAYVGVGLAEHSKAAQDEFERAIARAPEVRECHNVTGMIEYLLRVEVADIADYKRFHADVLGAIPQVRSITTYVVMGSPKDERA